MFAESCCANASLKGGIGSYVAQGLAAGAVTSDPQAQASGKAGTGKLTRGQAYLAQTGKLGMDTTKFPSASEFMSVAEQLASHQKKTPPFNPYVRCVASAAATRLLRRPKLHLADTSLEDCLYTDVVCRVLEPWYQGRARSGAGRPGRGTWIRQVNGRRCRSTKTTAAAFGTTWRH